MAQLNIDDQPGESIRYGAHRVTPVAQRVQLRLPKPLDFVVFNYGRPKAVQVETEAGVVHELKVDDPTRRAQVAIAIAGLLGVGVMWFIWGRRGQQPGKQRRSETNE